MITVTDLWSTSGSRPGDLSLPFHELAVRFAEPLDSSNIPEDENSLKPQKTRGWVAVAWVDGPAPRFLAAGEKLQQVIRLPDGGGTEVPPELKVRDRELAVVPHTRDMDSLFRTASRSWLIAADDADARPLWSGPFVPEEDPDGLSPAPLGLLAFKPRQGLAQLPSLEIENFSLPGIGFLLVLELLTLQPELL